MTYELPSTDDPNKEEKTELAKEKFRQEFKLASELYKRENGVEAENPDIALMYWAEDRKVYAEAFSALVKDPEFKNPDNKFNGKVSNVSLNDVEYFLENDKLPEALKPAA